MAVVEVWTLAGTALLGGTGYEPAARIRASSEMLERMRHVAGSAVQCVSGRLGQTASGWVAEGDAMEAAVHALSLRVGCGATPESPVQLRLAYTADRMLSSVVVAGAPSSSAHLRPSSPGVSVWLFTMSLTILPARSAGSGGS
jgi:hypothetical protein